MIESLKVGNVKTNEAKKFTNTFCKFFATVGKEYANKIPNSDHTTGYYLDKIPQNPHNMFMTPTTKYEVEKIKIKNSSGFDEVSNRRSKGITTRISTPLSFLINKSLEEGVLPKEMKKSETIPLYKSKEKWDKNNYRPISILLTLSKVLEVNMGSDLVILAKRQ